MKVFEPFAKKQVFQVAPYTLNGSFKCICCVSTPTMSKAKQTDPFARWFGNFFFVNTGGFDVPVMGLERIVGRIYKSKLLSLV